MCAASYRLVERNTGDVALTLVPGGDRGAPKWLQLTSIEAVCKIDSERRLNALRLYLNLLDSDHQLPHRNFDEVAQWVGVDQDALATLFDDLIGVGVMEWHS